MSREYTTRVDLPTEEVRARFAHELGHATAKVGVDAAVIDDDGRLLVILRTDDGCWALPGGWVDPNELPEDALVARTLRESSASSVPRADSWARWPSGVGATRMACGRRAGVPRDDRVH